MTRASVSGASPLSTNGNAEFGLHVFKRRASEQRGDRYTIGVWVGTCQRVICHDACIDGALAAVRGEMEKAGRSPGVPHPVSFNALAQTQTRESPPDKEVQHIGSYCHPADALRELVDMGDAPSCNVCGAICSRSGACFTCLTCGNSTSCG
jgi:hypothetical protein